MLLARSGAHIKARRMRASSCHWPGGRSPFSRWDSRAKLLVLVFIVCSLCASFWHAAPASSDLGPLALDIVGVAVKPTCTSQRAITALNQHLRPARIHVITSGAAQCDMFVRMADNVICHDEVNLLPGVNHSTVAMYLQQRFGSVDAVHKGRKLAGWYLQQFLKLGAASAIPGLSDYFVVWDLDMVLLRPISFLDFKGGRVRTAVNRGGARNIPGYVESYRRLTGSKLEFAPDGTSFVTHWMVVHKPFMKEMLQDIADKPPTNLEEAPPDISIHKVNHTTQRRRSLTQDSASPGHLRQTQLPPGNGSLYQADRGGNSGRGNRTEGEGINSMEDRETGEAKTFRGRGASRMNWERRLKAGEDVAVQKPLSLLWVWKILDAVPVDHVQLGFSEYATYVSWVHQKHPNTQFILPRRTWLRTPGGAWLTLWLKRFHSQGCCCPTEWVLKWLAFLGYHYTGFETGHVDACDFTNPKYELAYCLQEDRLLPPTSSSSLLHEA